MRSLHFGCLRFLRHLGAALLLSQSRVSEPWFHDLGFHELRPDLRFHELRPDLRFHESLSIWINFGPQGGFSSLHTRSVTSFNTTSIEAIASAPICSIPSRASVLLVYLPFQTVPLIQQCAYCFLTVQTHDLAANNFLLTSPLPPTLRGAAISAAMLLSNMSAQMPALQRSP